MVGWLLMNNLFERVKLSGPDKVEVRVRFWMRKRARLRFDSGQCECLTEGNYIKGCGECQGNNKKYYCVVIELVIPRFHSGQGEEGLRLPGYGLVRRRHTHVGAPDNRIEALYKEYVLTPRGKGHEPGTWTRGRRLTGKKAIISLWLRQRDF